MFEAFMVGLGVGVFYTLFLVWVHKELSPKRQPRTDAGGEG